MTTIKVVDSIMGSGKTSAAINMMNNDIDDYGEGNNYIFITPYLSEVERVKRSCTRKFYEPKFQTIHGEVYTKFDSLHSLLADGKCIASTHALFKRANEETRALIHGGNYILILDEVMDVIEQLEIKKDDIDLLFKQGLISVDADGFVHWNEEKKDYDTRYNDIRDMALNRTLIYYRDKILIWSFPADIFRSFQQVYILTYNFKSQIQRYYYDMFNIDYELYHAALEDGSYVFKPGLVDESDIRARIKQLINIYEGKLNAIGDEDYSLSKTWYDKRSKSSLQQLKNNISNYFKHITKSKSHEAMWTTFLSYKNKLKGEGYTKGFVPCTARATNDYRDRFNLAYTVNRYVNPIIYGFFHDKGITIDQDAYFIAELLQWLFRSAIRDDKPINLYIPSKRARTLLIKWLEGEL
jgi:hypothetical protein